MRGRGIIKNTAFSAVSLASGGGTATSAAFTGIAGGEDMSAFWQLTGANGDVKLEILVSEDGTNFVVPETGGTIVASTTDQNLHAKAVSVPVSAGYEIRATNIGAGTVTITVKMLSL